MPGDISLTISGALNLVGDVAPILSTPEALNHWWASYLSLDQGWASLIAHYTA